jgi:hypothetical protein
MLSRTVGRERFREVLAEFTRRHADQRVPWNTLLEAISAGAGRDLGWFYDRWFEGTGALDWTVAWEQHGDSLTGTVTLGTGPMYSTIDVRLEGKGCPVLARQVTLAGLETRFEWQVPCQVEKLTLDPGFQLLHWTPEYREAATALAPWTRANLLLNDGSNAEAEAAYRAALGAAPTDDPHGLIFMLRYGLGQALMAQDKIKDARRELEAALGSPVKRPAVVPWVYLELARVARKLDDGALLRRAARGAQDADLAAFGRPVVSPQIDAMLPGGA